MKPVAYMVVGEPHYRQPFLTAEEAAEVAALHGGALILPLVYLTEAAEAMAQIVNHAFCAKPPPRGKGGQ